MSTRAFLLCGDEKAVHAVAQILDELEVSFEHSGEPTFALKRLAAQRFDLLIVDCDNAQNATQVFNSARASNLNKNSIAVAELMRLLVDEFIWYPTPATSGSNLLWNWMGRPCALSPTSAISCWWTLAMDNAYGTNTCQQAPPSVVNCPR